MVSPLFTALALIAAGRVELPPASAQPGQVPEIRRAAQHKAPRRED